MTLLWPIGAPLDTPIFPTVRTPCNPQIRNRANDSSKVRFAARVESAAERTFAFLPLPRSSRAIGKRKPNGRLSSCGHSEDSPLVSDRGRQDPEKSVACLSNRRVAHPSQHQVLDNTGGYFSVILFLPAAEHDAGLQMDRSKLEEA